MRYKERIQVPNYKNTKIPVKIINDSNVLNHIVFSFSFFNGDSIVYKDFNNFYQNIEDSKKAVNDLFITMKEISNMDLQIFFSGNIKKQLHYNEFNDKATIERIEDILINGYGMTKVKVNDFERTYFEFSFGNGKRAIGTKLENNVLELLFIDCNHMICINSSRMIKIKNHFRYPSFFGKYLDDVNRKSYESMELVKMLFNDARDGLYKSINELISDYDDLFNYV